MMQPALASKVHLCSPMAWLGWIRGRHKMGGRVPASPSRNVPPVTASKPTAGMGR